HLANDLGLARGTVNKVYDALARDGLVETAGRHGTVVLAVTQGATTTTDDVAAAAEHLALVARQLNLSESATHAALSRALLATPRLPPSPPPTSADLGTRSTRS
ncbi:MAG: GntR family transcriptional regulator, partial [Actinomycetales bacterium]|nr:GntR family transcriptional regulator [Actinomycetales bacterium]